MIGSLKVSKAAKLCCSKSFGLKYSLCVAAACFITLTADGNVSGRSYDVQRLLEVDRQNRANHITFMSLHFCPHWSEYLYGEKEYKPINRPIRIMLKLDGEGNATVNPKNEPLGTSLDNLDLSKVTEKAAQENWYGRNKPDGIITFDLIPESGMTEMDVYHLDAKFENGKTMSSYRLRGIGIRNPRWVSLVDTSRETEKQPVTPPSAFENNDAP
jgi:hypothetical protein